MVEAGGQGHELRQGLPEAHVLPLAAQPLDNVWVLPVPTQTCLTEAGYIRNGPWRWGGGRNPQGQSLQLWEQGSLLEPGGGGGDIAGSLE